MFSKERYVSNFVIIFVQIIKAVSLQSVSMLMIIFVINIITEMERNTIVHQYIQINDNP